MDHSHPPATKNVSASDPAAGPDRGLIFIRYSDVDGDNIPDIDLTAVPRPDVSWELDETISYSVRTQPDGVNALVRTIAGVDTRVIARNVERVVFDTAATVGPLEVPLGAVRVRLWLYDVNDDGLEIRSQVEALIRMRNGEDI